MERLYFACPKTRQKIDTGIDTELETLLRIRANKIRMRCPFCRRPHEWKVADAELKAA